MYVNVGKNIEIPTSNVSRFQGRGIWDEGTGIFLNNETEVKPGDSIKVLMIAPLNSLIFFVTFYQNNNVWDIPLTGRYG